MKKNILILICLTLLSCNAIRNDNRNLQSQVDTTLNAWHKAATDANFNLYFGMMTEDAIFIGTDPKENWDKTAFKAYAKPFFDKGKAWTFVSLQRHIYFDETRKVAWFDELLNTQMKICRGSGVLIKSGNDWKIKHYVLSITIPNDNTNEVVKIIAPIEDVMITKMQLK